MKPLTKHRRALLQLILNGTLYSASMILGVFSVGYLIQNQFVTGRVFLFLTFLVSVGINILSLILFKKDKIYLAMFLFNIVAYTSLMVLSAFEPNAVMVIVTGEIFALTILADSIFMLVHTHKVRNVVFGVLRIIFSSLLILFYISTPRSNPVLFLVFVPLLIVLASFSHAMFLIFSGLKKKTLMKILQKTYAFEILYGMVTLIFASATMLYFIEGIFNNFGDALWYCFSVVTTIGFGDFAVTTFFGRIISVVLGIYGIVVVALITSIIVNFYNETSSNKDEIIREEMKKIAEKMELENSEKKEDKDAD